MKRLMITTAVILCAAVWFSVPRGAAQQDFAKLVNGEWLERNLDTENMRVIDARDAVSDYWQGHIPGAVFVPGEVLRRPQEGVPVKLMPLKSFAALLGELGIDNNTFVVVYSSGSDYNAAYFIWALDYLGHKRSAVLDGGFGKWEQENRAVTQDFPKIRRKNYRYSFFGVDKKARADINDVRYAAKRENIALLDVRPPELFQGKEGVGKRLGHISGARHHFWGDDLNADGTWKRKEELEALYEPLGISANTRCIVYCGQGLMSAHTYFTLRHVLGVSDASSYDGGFQEWSNNDELPVSKILIE